jgi:hypothetical protein
MVASGYTLLVLCAEGIIPADSLCMRHTTAPLAAAPVFWSGGALCIANTAHDFRSVALDRGKLFSA